MIVFAFKNDLWILRWASTSLSHDMKIRDTERTTQILNKKYVSHQTRKRYITRVRVKSTYVHKRVYNCSNSSNTDKQRAWESDELIK